MSVEVNLEKAYDSLIGEVIANRYRIETKIGEGAMGAVYRAKHVKVGRAFAVKVLHPRLLLDDKVTQRFEREAELAGRLRHPNVIGVVDVGETNGLRYMVMDFAEGPDLATLLNEAPMTPQRVSNLTRQLLEGLFHAHEQGLIHRDFKPENVIVEKDSHGNEVPRIVDFGIAILREGGESSAGPGRLTTNGLVLGTPHYMAPEQAVADPIDHRIDLFALGIIIYEMLCGKLPFDGTGAEVARANLLLDPPPISQRVPYLEVDPLLEAFARRLMAKKRDQRPTTAKIARDLLDLVERDRDAAAAALGVPLSAAREPMVTQPNTPVREHTGKETFPPPIRGAARTPPQAPPFGAPKAVASRPGEHHISTEQTATPARRTPMIVAAITTLGLLGGAAYIVLAGKDDKAGKAASPPPEVATATPTATTPPEPAPAEVTAPVPAPVVEPKVEDTPKVDDRAPKSTLPDQTPRITKPTKTRATPKTPPKSNPTNSATTNPTTATTKVDPPVVPTAEPKVVDSAMLAKQYQAVGGQLKTLREAKGADATDDLMQRFRLINIVDAMKSQPKRDAAWAVLTRLSKEIAARK
jgi:serine/threonine-protein kinase